MNDYVKINYTDYGNLLNALQRNNYVLKKIIVCYAVPNPQRHICTVGEKQFDRFFYIVKGSFFITFKDGSKITASSGEMIYLPSDIEYVSEWDKNNEGYYISFNFILESFDRKIVSLFKNPFLILDGYDRELYKQFNAAKKMDMKHDSFASIGLNIFYFQIIYCIAKKIEEKRIDAKSNKNAIYKSVVYLENNFLSDVNSEGLAQLCGMNVCDFRKKFKDYKGLSPMKYKNFLRMQYAHELLASGLYTVSEVSNIIGCSDYSHFNKLYKKEFGKNPSTDIFSH